MKTVFALPLILAACAPALPRCDLRIPPECRAEDRDCTCERPTSNLPDTARGEAEPRETVRPEPEKPDHEGEHHDPEPHRVSDEAAHDAWKERNGL